MSIQPIAQHWMAEAAQRTYIGGLFQAEARVEETVLGFLLGTGKVYAEPPAKLGDQWPQVLRWTTGITPRGYGWTRIGPNPGMIVQQDVAHTIFVACGVPGPEHGALQRRYDWVPLAWQECYGKNRDVDGAALRAWVERSAIRWALSQQYAGAHYSGWLIPMQATLQYQVELPA